MDFVATRPLMSPRWCQALASRGIRHPRDRSSWGTGFHPRGLRPSMPRYFGVFERLYVSDLINMPFLAFSPDIVCFLGQGGSLNKAGCHNLQVRTSKYTRTENANSGILDELIYLSRLRVGTQLLWRAALICPCI